MRPGRALDAKIAIKIMGLKSIEPEGIPYYSTEIYDAHKVIGKLQLNGWLCNISSKITDDGNLHYRAKFYQEGRECEKIAKSIPMAICISALSIVNDEYYEYIDILKKRDSSPIEIIGKNENSYSIIGLEDKDLISIIDEVIKENTANTAENVVDILRERGYIILKV